MTKEYGFLMMVHYTRYQIEAFRSDISEIEAREEWRNDGKDCRKIKWLTHENRKLPDTNKFHLICLVATWRINLLKFWYSENIHLDTVSNGLLCCNDGCMEIGPQMCIDCDSSMCLPCSDIIDSKGVCKKCRGKIVKKEHERVNSTPFMMFKGGPLIIGQLFVKNGNIGIYPHCE